MRAATHCAGAVLAALGVSLAVRPGAASVLGMAGMAFLSAPWPDLDNLGTWSRRRKLGKGPLARQFTVRRHPAKRVASWVVTRFGSHRRGPFHSLVGGLIAAGAWAVPAAFWPAWPLAWPAGVLIGWWSHLALDLTNRQPIALLWPLPGLVHGLPGWLRCKVGGWGEIAWCVLIAAGLVECVLHLGLA